MKAYIERNIRFDFLTIFFSCIVMVAVSWVALASVIFEPTLDQLLFLLLACSIILAATSPSAIRLKNAAAFARKHKNNLKEE